MSLLSLLHRLPRPHSQQPLSRLAALIDQKTLPLNYSAHLHTLSLLNTIKIGQIILKFDAKLKNVFLGNDMWKTNHQKPLFLLSYCSCSLKQIVVTPVEETLRPTDNLEDFLSTMQSSRKPKEFEDLHELVTFFFTVETISWTAQTYFLND